MRVGIDVRPLINGRRSGIPEFSYQIVRALLSLDRVNDYFLFSNSLKKFPEINFSSSNYKNNFFRLPGKIFNLFIIIFNWPKINKLSGGADIFLSPNIDFSSFSQPCRNILVIHDLSPFIYPEFFTAKILLWHYFLKFKKQLREAKIIIAVSESTKSDLIKYFNIADEKIKVVYHGVDKKLEKISDNNILFSAKKKYNLPEKYILSLCTLEPRKNILGLIKAYEKLKQEENITPDLVIAGGYGWKYKQVLKAWKKSPFKNSIKFIGYVAEEDKAAIYSLADVFVFPSFYEGFGLPILEAFACGAPVITSAVSGMPEVAGDAAVLIDPNNISDLKSAIKNILSSEELKTRLITRGLDRVKLFSWEKAGKSYLEIIESLKK